MPNAREDEMAIEAVADLLAQGLNKSDISSLTDLVTEKTVLLAPARGTAKGRAVVDFWRNMALQNSGIKLLSTELDSIADGVVRDLGTLSMRPKKGDRNYFRYMIVWHKVGQDWKLASMAWNRDAQSAARNRPGAQGGASATTYGGGGTGDM